MHFFLRVFLPYLTCVGEKVAGKGPARVIPTGQAARDIRHQRNKNVCAVMLNLVLGDTSVYIFFFCLCNIIEGKCIFGVCDVLSVEKILLTLFSCDEQIREQKRAGVLAEKRASSSSSSAPRILVRVTLFTSFSRTNYCSIYLEANQQLMEFIRM